MEKRVVFNNKILPYILVAPQIIITLVFFIWPAGHALYQSLDSSNSTDRWAISRDTNWWDRCADVTDSNP